MGIEKQGCGCDGLLFIYFIFFYLFIISSIFFAWREPFFVEPTCGKTRHKCHNICKVYVRVCVRECIRPSVGTIQAITSTFMHGFQI